MSKMTTAVEDFKSLVVWKAIIAEFIGTVLLVLIGCGSCVQGWEKGPNSLDVVQISISFGLTVATVIWIIGSISGGHINPAVTCAMLVTRRVSILRGIFYMYAQLAGAVVGSALLKAVTPSHVTKSLGATTLGRSMTGCMGFGVEFFITFGLVLTVFSSCDSKRTDLKGSFPLTIGLSVVMAHMWAVKYTGSSMNPARSFGPAVIMNIWTDHWVYWAGPIGGGICAGLLYESLLAENASVKKAVLLLMTSDFKVPSATLKDIADTTELDESKEYELVATKDLDEFEEMETADI